MTRRVLIIHFTPPGVIGGVEHIIEQHLNLLAAHGFSAEIVAGRDGHSSVPIHVIPEIDAAQPQSEALESELAEGIVGPEFETRREIIRQRLIPLVDQADMVIAHNAFSLHFCLPLTSVLWELAAQRTYGSTIAWCHDLSWTNPLYLPAMHGGYPWELLRTPAPNTRYVAISRERRRELLDLWRTVPSCPVDVVPNGIDVEKFLRLSETSKTIARQHDLFDRDIVLLLPVRITRRKNIEVGIRTVAALHRKGVDACFVISGPVAPHHPVRSRAYLQELKDLAAELQIEQHVIFVADELGHNLDSTALSELYSLADVLFFPSAQEGFGLPILEAGLARVPVVLSDIPIFREIGGSDVATFGLADAPDTIAEGIMRTLNTSPSRLYRRVLRQFRWDALMEQKILPLLNEPSGMQTDPGEGDQA